MHRGDGESGSTGAITALLTKMADGEPAALDELFPMVYAELRRIARGQRRRQGAALTLNTTGLIHEAYLKFARSDRELPSHREHFFAVAATAMRQILLDEAKARLRDKRGGGAPHQALDEDVAAVNEQAELLVAFDQGLERLGAIEKRAREVVEYRYFGGLTEQETANILGVDPRTVRRDWAMARAWLADELSALLRES